MDVTIRIAIPEDAEILHRILQAAYAEYRHLEVSSSALDETVDSITRALRQGERAIVAEVGGRPVGSVRFCLGNEELYFFRLAVIPEARGKGLAKAMLAWLETYAVRKGKKIIRCKARFAIPRNISLYLSVGYHIGGEETVIENGVPLRLATMVKTLPAAPDGGIPAFPGVSPTDKVLLG